MHPWDRLHRAVLGERFHEPRGLAKALFARDREVQAHPTLLSAMTESLKVREPKVRKAQNVAHPRPNAPLLKRIVRHPMQMDAVSGRVRVQLRAAVPWSDLDRENLPTPSKVLAECRIEATLGNPVIEIRRMRDLKRPRPSAEGWLGDLAAGDRA